VSIAGTSQLIPTVPLGHVEKRLWPADPGAHGGRKARRPGAYEVFIPDEISGRDFPLDGDAVAAVTEATRALQHQEASPPRIATLGALAQNLLRSESVTSSRIEGVHLSHKRLARAAFQADRGQRDQRAAEVLGSVEAMKHAIEIGTAGKPLTTSDIEDIHRTLLRFSEHADIAGVVRESQNWIGGNDYNPIGAAYVPPPPEYVRPLLDDLCVFATRTDLAPIVQAGVVHAQFETIHPFADCNGRVGERSSTRSCAAVARSRTTSLRSVSSSPPSRRGTSAGSLASAKAESAHGSRSSPTRLHGRRQRPSDSPTLPSSSNQPGSTTSANPEEMRRFGSSSVRCRGSPWSTSRSPRRSQASRTLRLVRLRKSSSARESWKGSTSASGAAFGSATSCSTWSMRSRRASGCSARSNTQSSVSWTWRH
jgi:hypothetical protein